MGLITGSVQTVWWAVHSCNGWFISERCLKVLSVPHFAIKIVKVDVLMQYVSPNSCNAEFSTFDLCVQNQLVVRI